MAVTYTDEAKNAAVDATTILNNAGKVRLYSGTIPTDVNTALSGNTVLTEHDFSATAYIPSVSGVAEENIISSGTGTAGAGVGTDATFYRTFKSDGTTAVSQGTITATGGGGDITISNVTIADGDVININDFPRSFV